MSMLGPSDKEFRKLYRIPKNQSLVEFARTKLRIPAWVPKEIDRNIERYYFTYYNQQNSLKTPGQDFKHYERFLKTNAMKDIWGKLKKEIIKPAAQKHIRSAYAEHNLCDDEIHLGALNRFASSVSGGTIGYKTYENLRVSNSQMQSDFIMPLTKKASALREFINEKLCKPEEFGEPAAKIIGSLIYFDEKIKGLPIALEELLKKLKDFDVHKNNNPGSNQFIAFGAMNIAAYPQKKPKHARRDLFIKTMCYSNRRFIGKPLHSIVCDLVSVIFEEDLDEDFVKKIEKRGRLHPQKK